MGDKGFIVECIDLVECNEDAAVACPGGFTMVAIAGREYNKSVGTERGAIKQMQVECKVDDVAEAGKPDAAPPTGVAGFVFDSTLEAVGEACRAAGHEYRSEGTPRCSGLPTDLGLDAFGSFEACDGKLCIIEVGVRPGDVDDVTWHARFRELLAKLTEKYGNPKSDAGAFEAACYYPEKCTKLARLQASYNWSWESGETIELRVRSDLPRGPLMTLEYASAAKTKVRRAGGL